MIFLQEMKHLWSAGGIRFLEHICGQFPLVIVVTSVPSSWTLTSAATLPSACENIVIVVELENCPVFIWHSLSTIERATECEE